MRKVEEENRTRVTLRHKDFTTTEVLITESTNAPPPEFRQWIEAEVNDINVVLSMTEIVPPSTERMLTPEERAIREEKKERSHAWYSAAAFFFVTLTYAAYWTIYIMLYPAVILTMVFSYLAWKHKPKRLQ
ncbi:MAG: hypothetical protein ACFFEX_15280 [Candidatus Thorarchaeota archaeon]